MEGNNVLENKIVQNSNVYNNKNKHEMWNVKLNFKSMEFALI